MLGRALGRDLPAASTSPRTTASAGSSRPPRACPAQRRARPSWPIAPSDGNIVYALFASGPSFWRTTDGGATWTQMTTGSNACDGQCWYNMVLRVHRTNPDIVYPRHDPHLHVDQRRLELDRPVQQLGLEPEGAPGHARPADAPDHPETFYVGGDGGIWKTDERRQQLHQPQRQPQHHPVLRGGRATPTTPRRSAAAPRTTARWPAPTTTLGPAGGHRRRLRLPASTRRTRTTPTSPPTPTAAIPTCRRSTSGVFGSFYGITGSSSGIIGGRPHQLGHALRARSGHPEHPLPGHAARLPLGQPRQQLDADSALDDMTGGSGSLKALEVNRELPVLRLRRQRPAAGSGARSNGGTDWTDITRRAARSLDQRHRRRPDRSRPRLRRGRRLQHRPPVGVERRSRLDRAARRASQRAGQHGADARRDTTCWSAPTPASSAASTVA